MLMRTSYLILNGRSISRYINSCNAEERRLELNHYKTGDYPVKRIVTKERTQGIYRRCWMSSFGRWPTYIGLTNETLSSVLDTCKYLNERLLFACFFTLLANPQTSAFFEASLAPFLWMEPLSYLWIYFARSETSHRCPGALLCLVTPTKAMEIPGISRDLGPRK